MIHVGNATIDVSVTLEKNTGTREDQSSSIALKHPEAENRKVLLRSTSNLVTKTQKTSSGMNKNTSTPIT